jgi:LmbE family N-acetylglucosaminyl deacetylase
VTPPPMNILAIAVHPDDETLGCGGTLLRLAAEGASLHWLLLTAIHPPHCPPDQVLRQQRQVEAAREAFPFASLDWLKHPAVELERVPMGQLVNDIRTVVARVRPEIVFIPNRCDAHSDHRVAFQAIHGVLKSFYLKALGVRRVLMCDVISETDAAAPLPENVFLPNVFMDISETIERKLEIMSLFASEVHPEPLPRSLSAIRAQARYRGATVATQYAECFMLLREIL